MADTRLRVPLEAPLPVVRRRAKRPCRPSASMACEQMLAEKAFAPEPTARPQCEIEAATAGSLIPGGVRNDGIDLGVRGSNGHGICMKRLHGSTTGTRPPAIDCDVMVARGGT